MFFFRKRIWVSGCKIKHFSPFAKIQLNKNMKSCKFAMSFPAKVTSLWSFFYSLAFIV